MPVLPEDLPVPLATQPVMTGRADAIAPAAIRQFGLPNTRTALATGAARYAVMAVGFGWLAALNWPERAWSHPLFSVIFDLVVPAALGVLAVLTLCLGLASGLALATAGRLYLSVGPDGIALPAVVAGKIAYTEILAATAIDGQRRRWLQISLAMPGRRRRFWPLRRTRTLRAWVADPDAAAAAITVHLAATRPAA
jgi:hypothetical protein